MEVVIRRKSYKKIRFRGVIIILIATVFMLLSIYLINHNMRPALLSYAKARAETLATNAMNEAILAVMQDDTKYGSLIESFGDGSRIYMLQTNTRNMNMLAVECSQSSLESISQLGAQGISVPVGTISGVSFFSGQGPQIKVQFTPSGSVKSEFRSELKSAGINQSLYRVYLKLTTTICIVLPGVNDTVTVSSEVAIAENIIAGDVPQVYTNVANEEDMLNLLPTELP